MFPCLTLPPLPALAQRKLLEDPKFLAYLKHLTYWKRPEYARFILCVLTVLAASYNPLVSLLHTPRRYPHCLFYLDRLQSEEFRTELTKPGVAQYLTQQQFLHWQHSLNRLRAPVDPRAAALFGQRPDAAAAAAAAPVAAAAPSPAPDTAMGSDSDNGSDSDDSDDSDGDVLELPPPPPPPPAAPAP